MLYVQRSVGITDKSFGLLRSTVEGYVRCNERLRSKSLKLAAVLALMAEGQGRETSAMLHTVSRLVREREASREAMDGRLESLVAAPLRIYGVGPQALCAKLRNDVRARKAAEEAERKKQDTFDNLILKDSADPGARARIVGASAWLVAAPAGSAYAGAKSQSQMELAGAAQTVRNSTIVLHDSVIDFERRRRNDLKRALSELIWTEMAMHARALELLTEAHQVVNDTNFEAEIEKVQLILNELRTQSAN
ncbi:hypothetical protein HK105_202773 [Polyrhizophydium stewartii]|uniref:Uncharacterized protein n=1 Tax=Polyrhizophydium stewartii TaxID=2732419 RepID=A0ABR4ND85_9FUNG